MAKKSSKAKEDSPLKSEQRQAALEEYEKGIRLLQKKDYSKAIPRFEAVLNDYPDELMLGDRSRVYLTIARGETKAKHPETSTRDAAKSFEVGVWLLNDGQAEKAVRHLERAAEHEPDDDGVLVALAAARLEAGQREQAVADLKKAVELRPEARFRIRLMSDFEPLASDGEFRALVQT